MQKGMKIILLVIQTE